MKIISEKELRSAGKKLSEMKASKRPLTFAYSIETWKALRSMNVCFAQWTDEEILNFRKSDFFIGVKAGCYCYLLNDEIWNKSKKH